MKYQYQLRISPKAAATKELLWKEVSGHSGIPVSDISHIEVLKRSIDARQIAVKINLKVDVYVNEEFLYELGVANYRVRYHGNVARLEVAPEEFSRFLDPELRRKVSEQFHAAGFEFVSLDLDGYRAGSMNGPDA